jgi:hypothetical protein
VKNDSVGVRVAFFGKVLPMEAASPAEGPLAGIRFTRLYRTTGHKNAATKTSIPISTQYPAMPLGRLDRDDLRLSRRAGLASSVESLAERDRELVWGIFLNSCGGTSELG